jgi:signal transduction histidine kinase
MTWHRHDDWPQHVARWGRRMAREARRHAERVQREADRHGCGPAWPFDPAAWAHTKPARVKPLTPEEEALRRARRRVAALTGFYIHFACYVGVIGLLFIINMLTSPLKPWFLWPAFGWGIGIFFHFMGVFGSRWVKERFFDPAMERELHRERATFQTEKQASIDELSSSIAHEIRNPIAAAKSLVQQMGEDPTSVENIEYAKVALSELDRVEHRVSHLLKFAKEEDYRFGLVNVATVVDSALTQLKAKLDAAKVQVARNYIGGPTVNADAEKLRGVFVNVLDNAIDALAKVPEGRRIDLFIENGDRGALVRVRDNGCGIPAEKLDRIFNPFFTTKETGTGLGMAIAKKIVEAHTGTIDARSAVGRGTEFQVTLPLPAA